MVYHHAMSRPALTVIVAGLLATGLSGCRYAFVPAVPRPVEVTMPARVTGATLTRAGAMLTVQAQVDGRFEAGYLKVQWFDGPRKVAEDSVYVDGDQRRATFTLEAPEPGSYRAVLSLGGTVLRQVELYEVQP